MILVVDDDKALADVVVTLLVDEGYDVMVAYDGIQALSAVGEARPDLVVSDVQMPGISGIQLALHLKEHGIPIILMTSRPDVVERRDLECLPKPFDLDTFLERVSLALDR
jgi:two-component system response regulator MprA